MGQSNSNLSVGAYVEDEQCEIGESLPSQDDLDADLAKDLNEPVPEEND
jgi:hypothetical protein